jgi:TonB family protein
VKPLLFIFIVLSVPCAGQVAPVVSRYYDKDWKEIKDPNQAVYYRTVEKKDNKFFVTDFYAATQKPQMEAFCSSIEPEVYDGVAIWYYLSGKKRKEALFKDGNYIGVVKLYYEDGARKAEVNFTDSKEIKYLQHWSNQGVGQLEQGSGFVVDESSDLPFGKHKIIHDHTVIGSFDIEGPAKDTVFMTAEKPAEFQGGLSRLANQLKLRTVYPVEARRRKIEGVVFVGFIVDQNGRLTNAAIVKGDVGGGCDEEALRVVKQLGPWNPALVSGIAVKSRLIQPVSFRLH